MSLRPRACCVRRTRHPCSSMKGIRHTRTERRPRREEPLDTCAGPGPRCGPMPCPCAPSQDVWTSEIAYVWRVHGVSTTLFNDNPSGLPTPSGTLRGFEP
eukprot:50592-Chlamydomonas_euryale.AAC.3